MFSRPSGNVKGPLKPIDLDSGSTKLSVFLKSKIEECKMEKARVEILVSSLITAWKSLIWDQYLRENYGFRILIC